MDVLMVLIWIIIFCSLTYLIVTISDYSKCMKNVRRVLLVIAHPDDECMFFAPTLLNLCKNNLTEVHLLCLSSGNYYKEGRTRKNELQKSCNILKIQMSNITIVEHSAMPDDPTCNWRADLVGNIIIKFIEKLSVDTVFTFDSRGISGHSNHISIYKGCNYLLEEGLIPKGCKIYLLETVNIIRKYSIMFDIVLSYLMSQHLFISSLGEVRLAQKAMSCHSSQMFWFRKLYVIFSRYMFINTYKELCSPQYHFDKDN